MMSANQYMKEQDAHAAREEAIEQKTEVVLEAMLDNGKVKLGGDTYHMDDFIADVDINTCDMIWLIKGAHEDLRGNMEEKLSEWCKDIATELVDKGE